MLNVANKSVVCPPREEAVCLRRINLQKSSA